MNECVSPQTLLELVEVGWEKRNEPHLASCRSCRELLAQLLRERSSLEDGSIDGDFASADPDWPPELPNYQLEGIVSRGGFGVVWRALDRRSGRRVALKQMPVHDAESLARFWREVQITTELDHPSIAAVYEAGAWHCGDMFYAMELLEGATLRERIDQARTFCERLADVPRLIAVAEAIAYAHERGIVHRDLKPANVIVGPHDRTVVLDWGLAERLGAAQEKESAGAMIGTPGYMAPECARGIAGGIRADVYGLGATFYHLLAGRPPYPGGPPPSLTERTPEVPVELAAIVEKAMALEPADRHDSMRTFAAELRRYGRGFA